MRSGGRPRVAFCGIGRMGSQMVANLADRGFQVAVWNRDHTRAVAVADGALVQVADTPAAAAAGADVVVTVLTDGDAVLSTLTRDDGILTGARPGAVVVDCSTTGAAAARDAAASCASSDVAFVDCPVSGSTVVARQGRLGLMAGGRTEDIERARPVLEAMGTVVHVGPTGSGAAAKVAVNAVLHTFSTALAESLVVARAAGVDADRLFDVLSVGVLWNRFLDYKRPAFVSPQDVPVAFDLRTATKDLDLAVRAAEHAGIAGSVAERARDLHRAALSAGFGDRDMAALTTWFNETSEAGGNPTADESRAPDRRRERN